MLNNIYVMSSKKQLIDPLGAICRLILLNFKTIGTKIRIKNHAVILQDPSYTQGTTRFLSGDGREDISELLISIVRMIKWYVIPASHEVNKCFSTREIGVQTEEIELNDEYEEVVEEKKEKKEKNDKD